MTIRDEINRIYREFHRYTGDGLPNEPTGAPLPVGDPQSGVHSPKKAHLRDGFGNVGDIIDAAAVSTGENAQRAEDAADAAEGFRDQAEAIVGFDGTAATVGVSPSVADATNVQEALEALEALAGTGSVYDTALDVQAATIGDDTTSLQTLGRATIGDSGGATYRRREVIEADADGDLVSDNGVRFALETSNPTPQMFGFIPDGATTDMTPGIQAANDYLIARHPQGGTVILPPCKSVPEFYRMVGGVLASPGIHFRGVKFGTEIRYEGTGYAFTWGEDTASVLTYGGGIQGVYLLLTSPLGNAVRLNGTVGVEVRSVKFEGPFSDFATKENIGVLISGANISSFWNVFEDVQMTHIYEGFAFTNITVNATQQIFINCGIVGNYSQGSVNSKGFIFSGTVNDSGSGSIIYGCYLENLGTGIQHNSVSGQITVTGTEFEITNDGTAKCVRYTGSGNGNKSNYANNIRLTSISGTPAEGCNKVIRGVSVYGDIFRLGGDGATYNDWFEFYEEAFAHSQDNGANLGSAGQRFGTVFAVTGTINTSDEREKQQIGAIPDAWLDAWEGVEWVRFKWNDAVEKKGEEARWHVGLIAQQVKAAFAAHGIDAHEIGLLCYDEWEDSPHNETKAGSRFGLRYEQCQAIEAAYQRRRMDRIEARLAALEA